MVTSNTEGQLGTALDRLDRLLADERRRTDEDRRRLEWLLGRNALALERIDLRLTAIEAALGKRLSPDKLLKLAIGIGLPLAALLATGNLEAALRLLALL